MLHIMLNTLFVMKILLACLFFFFAHALANILTISESQWPSIFSKLVSAESTLY